MSINNNSNNIVIPRSELNESKQNQSPFSGSTIFEHEEPGNSLSQKDFVNRNLNSVSNNDAIDRSNVQDTAHAEASNVTNSINNPAFLAAVPQHGNIENTGNDNNSAPNNNSTVNGNNEDLLFFNYHEYSIEKYESLDTHVYEKHDHPLIITHFPNPYVDPSSYEYKTTRVVRVPRMYNEPSNSNNLFPQFLQLIPGFEEAAIVDPIESLLDQNINKFIPRGKHYGQLYGCSSVSPLSDYISPSEFEAILNKVNKYLKDALNALKFENVISGIANFVTMWIFDQLIENHSKKKLQELEDYVTEINDTQLRNKKIKIVSPRRSGYVSLDFVIPKPTLD